MKLIIASGNEGKIREFRELLSNYGFEVASAKEAGVPMNVVEDGNSFFENAKKKAEFLVKKTGNAALADDSGLCVDALSGAPGIYSARFSGEIASDRDNNSKLLTMMKDERQRTAHFACSIVLIFPDGRILHGYGETNGEILKKEVGQNGFGYDPLFYSNDLKKSFGEAAPDEKNQISHRARALKDLCHQLNLTK